MIEEDPDQVREVVHLALDGGEMRQNIRIEQIIYSVSIDVNRYAQK
jgi:hypothetical protein